MKRYRAIADYYDAEYAHSRMLKHDVPFFLGQLPRKKQSILELCVGTARAAIPIAQAGHAVTGVDYAGDLLALARQKRDFVGLTERQLRLINGDALKVKLQQRFDWVCIFFNTLLAFPTLSEQDRLLGVVRDHLKPSGRLWIDIFNPDLHLLTSPQTRGLDPNSFYVPALNRTVSQTTEIRRHLSRQTQDVTFHYCWFDEHGKSHKQRVRFAMTWLFPRELQLLLERNGLRIERLFGNYDGSEVGASSPRLIARCVLMK